MSVRGDFAALERLAANLAELGQVPSRAAASAADELGAIVQMQFDAGVDPYGDAWAPLAESTIAKGRDEPPLTDSGSMASGIQVRPARGAGIEFTVEAEYAQFHQTGTRNMPARKILPDGDELPPHWDEVIERSVNDAFEKQMGGR